MKKARGEVRRLLIVISELQDKIGKAHGLHYDDRSKTSFEEAQKALEEAFRLCVETTSTYEPIDS